ncbi:MAG: trypsin-like serine peptidase [bacterium]
MVPKYKDNQHKILEAPMTNEDLVQLDNKLDQADSPELLELRRNAALYITALSDELDADDFKMTKIGKKGMWSFQLGSNFTVGQLGDEIEELPRSDDLVFEAENLDPHIPSWSGIAYHPKISGPREVRSMRRVRGSRVTPHYIFGPDDRQVYYPSAYPWRCVGRVFAWTDPSSPGPSWSGAGALVGRNVVVTASHVVPWGSSPWMMQFIPAYYDGASLLGSGVYSYVQSVRGYKNHGQGDDMAVLKLYTPLGNTLGWFGTKTYHDSWEDGNYWTKCGYPGAVAFGQRPSRITWFPIIDDDNDGAGVELEYRADSSGGDSGGPVFGWWSGLPYIIGAHSGGEQEYHFPFSIVKNNVAAGGSALPNLVIWAHNNW